jgi:hypothetical protein
MGSPGNPRRGPAGTRARSPVRKLDPSAASPRSPRTPRVTRPRNTPAVPLQATLVLSPEIATWSALSAPGVWPELNDANEFA